MKIIFCIRGTFNSGGMEKVLSQKTNYFYEKLGYECLIVTTDQKKRKDFFYFNENIKKIDLDINYEENKGSFLKKTIFFIIKQSTHKKRLKKIILKEKPNIIISMGDEEKLFLPSIKNKTKIILEHHFFKGFKILESEKKSFLYKVRAKILSRLEEKLIRKYDEFLVLTQEDKKYYNDVRVKVINNALVDYPKNIANLEAKKIISVGRLEYQKGFDILIEVWKKIAKKYPDWSLDIYGDGELWKELQKKIDEYNLSNSIFLKGREKSIQNKYLESSIYVMTSRYEGFGMVLVEAQAAGLPIVSFDCPCGPKDIITNGEDGFLCKFGDIYEMYNRISYLIENEDVRKVMGKKARENSLRFNEEKVMKKWKNLLENLVQKG